MNTNKQNPDFLYIGEKLLKWYKEHGRDLPFRKTKNPYLIWICEIIFQQTRIQQGLNHYNRFVERFPDAETLSNAENDEVLLYWKGLGYYSRALNVHSAAKQIMNDFEGKFPQNYEDVLKLKGVGKYTASAICSICFGKQLPAVDGNFYRVLSRIFADSFNVSSSKAQDYFAALAFRIMPKNKAGDFNQAMMDLGSEICKPRNPLCNECPVNDFCAAFISDKIQEFPVKTKKTKVSELKMIYYFVSYENNFLIRQRKDDFIWKKLYEFPAIIPQNFRNYITGFKTIKHKLTHKNMEIQIYHVKLNSQEKFEYLAKKEGFLIVDFDESQNKSFPKPLENYLKQCFLHH